MPAWTGGGDSVHPSAGTELLSTGTVLLSAGTMLLSVGTVLTAPVTVLPPAGAVLSSTGTELILRRFNFDRFISIQRLTSRRRFEQK